MWSSREDSEEKSPPAEAPATGPAERKSTTNGDDARPAGLLHEPHELSTSTLAKLEAASDEVEFQQSIWDASLFLFNPVVGRSASLFAFVLLAVNVFLQGSFAFYLIDGLDRDATTPICPAHQRRTFLPGCQDEFSPELCCPRHPRAYGFDVGFSSVGTSGTARAAAAGE